MSIPSTRFPGGRPRLLLNAFLMNTTSHIRGGQWRHPDAEQHRFNELSFWTDLARQLEAAKFDALFFADVVGLYGNHDGGWSSHVRRGLQVPANDPLLLLAALSGATRDIGLAATSSVVQSHPFQFARQLSTLDHLSGGRAGWNIVTSVLENAHRNFGGDGLTEHDRRYDWADEYTDAVYKLWEGSWDDGALVQDKASGVHADPDKVHKIHHRGERYSIDGPHLSSPSPQRTPGALPGRKFRPRAAVRCSQRRGDVHLRPQPRPRGQGLRGSPGTRRRRRAAARRHQGLHRPVLRGGRHRSRSTAEKGRAGRIPGPGCRDRAHRRRPGHRPRRTGPGHPAGGRTDRRRPGSTAGDHRLHPGGNPTLADVARYRTEAQQVTGTPEQIADELERWQDAGVDGINIINAILPGSYTDFIDGVLPELRRRGLAQSEYAPGTLREKLFGAGPLLNERHRASQFRGAFTPENTLATPGATR